MMEEDHSFSKNPKQDGSILKAARDIIRATKNLPLDSTDERIQHLLLYGMCEKLAVCMHGAVKRVPMKKLFHPTKGYKVTVELTAEACSTIGFRVSKSDLNMIFDPKNPTSARRLRNDFLHRPGPTHLSLIAKGTPVMLPAMRNFLRGVDRLSRHIYSQP